MRFLPLCLMLVVAACASTTDANPYPEAQKAVEAVSAKHSELTRLTLHAVPAGSSQCTQIASTVAGRRGKPSDPEDLEALRTGAEVVLEESGAVDVTVPILSQGGKATAVAGVTVRAETALDRPSVLARARAIAKELEAELRAADKPLW